MREHAQSASSGHPPGISLPLVLLVFLVQWVQQQSSGLFSGWCNGPNKQVVRSALAWLEGRLAARLPLG